MTDDTKARDEHNVDGYGQHQIEGWFCRACHWQTSDYTLSFDQAKAKHDEFNGIAPAALPAREPVTEDELAEAIWRNGDAPTAQLAARWILEDFDVTKKETK